MAENPQTATSSSATLSSSDQQPSSTSSTEPNLKQPQVPAFSGFPGFGNGGDVGTLPVMYPAAFGGLNPWENQQETNNRGAGIYAVPVLPYTGIPSNTLIPLTYNIPTTRTSTEAGAVGSEHGQAGQELHQQQQARQRQVVVRRFQIAFQLDLLLILKLAAVIFVFNQDGSRLRLTVLVIFASLIYLYQTGALTPFLRWLSQSMQRAAQPPHPPRPAVRAENVHAAARQVNEIAGVADGQARAENENQPLNDGNQAAENENIADPAANRGNQWWGIVKEIQMIVFGFITSLLPGFHNLD
ncbi:Transmembrane protein [Melia azedarach]|uniref:Transmembrane protein n=1 Tax=Melia azedarach TaxID=155640 RepID=A0ACC1XEY0_MELAZ|nr:Transmembrane protein [Melia azedarach]